MTVKILETKSVVKSFGKNLVLNGINFQAFKGEIVAICGKNGSGKSVFIRVLCGLMRPDRGEVTIFGDTLGTDVEFPRSTGIHFESSGALLRKSGHENLLLLSLVSGKATPDRIAALLELVGLDPADRRPVSSYSTGMRQRLGIAQALLDDPELILLDEPVNGLDFAGQEHFYKLLRTFREEGKTILFTSHNKEEITAIADRAFEMRNGQLHPFAVSDPSICPMRSSTGGNSAGPYSRPTTPDQNASILPSACSD